MNTRWYFYGLAIILAGILFRQPLLVVVGILIVFIVGATDIWTTYCLRDLHYRRQFSEQRVLFGEQVTLSLSLENAKLLPLPWVEVADAVPRLLAFPAQRLRSDPYSNRMLLENLFSPRWYERITRRYTLYCNARGVHTFGPAVLRSGDLFGFRVREESLPNWQYLLVYPLVVPLTRFGLPSRHPFGDLRAPRRLLEDPARVIGVRDYAYGDSLRRVHWKATARTMQLQSKVYEATTTYTLLLFLDVASQMDAWYGIHPELEELTICAAASVVNWAFDQGFAVGLYANTILFLPEEGLSPAPGQEEEAKQAVEEMVGAQLKRRRIHFPPASSEEQRLRLMDALARIQPYFSATIEEVIGKEQTRFPTGATVVIITRAITDGLLDILARVRQAGHAVSILFVGNDPPSAKLMGVTLYALGGEDTWKELEAAYSKPTDETALLKQSSLGFHL